MAEISCLLQEIDTKDGERTGGRTDGKLLPRTELFGNDLQDEDGTSSRWNLRLAKEVR